MVRNLLCCVLLGATSLFAQDKSNIPNPSDDFESNTSCLSGRCLSFQYLDNRSLPRVKVAPSFQTKLEFPLYLRSCGTGADKVYRLVAILGDGREVPMGGEAVSEPFKAIKILVKPDLGVGVFDAPPTNLQCLGQNGVTYDIYLVVDDFPHHQVRFGFKVPKGGSESVLRLLEGNVSKEGLGAPLRRIDGVGKGKSKVKSKGGAEEAVLRLLERGPSK